MLLFKSLRYFCRSLRLNSYLESNLKANQLLPLRDLQIKTLRTCKVHGNIFLNQPDGSGKTLAYLIPILNEIISSKIQKREAPKTIIVTLNKQLSLQIYQQIRKLDPKRMLKVNRTGSISHYGPVIDEMCKPSKQQDHDLIVELMDKNVNDSVVWGKTDILITTPKLFYRIIEAKHEDKVQITPRYVVIDEIDVIIQQKNLLNYMKKGLEYIQTATAKNQKTSSYFLVSANKNCKDLLNNNDCKLPKIQQMSMVECQNDSAILKNLRVNFIKIKGEQKQDIKRQKIAQLLKIISKPERKRIVVYCQTQKIQQIKYAVSQLPNIISSQIYGRLSTQKRMLSLFNFIDGQSNLLITNDVTSRGFNFGKEVDIIISFDMNSLQEQQNRMSRTNKVGGQYIILAEERQQTQLEKIQKQLEAHKIKVEKQLEAL